MLMPGTRRFSGSLLQLLPDATGVLRNAALLDPQEIPVLQNFSKAQHKKPDFQGL